MKPWNSSLLAMENPDRKSSPCLALSLNRLTSCPRLLKTDFPCSFHYAKARQGKYPTGKNSLSVWVVPVVPARFGYSR
jgi:hypothetical protein